MYDKKNESKNIREREHVNNNYKLSDFLPSSW